jgi:hypothetical protein
MGHPERDEALSGDNPFREQLLELCGGYPPTDRHRASMQTLADAVQCLIVMKGAFLPFDGGKGAFMPLGL